ncbi:MAG: hypothetical protein IBJ18_11110 [Phycisphaerales bacterium]|nr:hypothetical protein [Phycisphaerales bacterium]
MNSTDEQLVLAIENSNPASRAGGISPAQVALGLVDRAAGRVLRTLGEQPIRELGRGEDDLVSAIDRVMSEAGRTPREIGLVAVSTGPGGYTALRMAIAAAKMIAMVSGARCVSVPSAWCAARNARLDLRSSQAKPDESAEASAFAPLLSVKGEQAFTQIVTRAMLDQPNPALPEGILVGPNDLPRVLSAGTALLIDDHTPKALLERAASLNIPTYRTRLSAEAVLEGAARLTEIDLSHLTPIYAREPEAVTLWRQRHGKVN